MCVHAREVGAAFGRINLIGLGLLCWVLTVLIPALASK